MDNSEQLSSRVTSADIAAKLKKMIRDGDYAPGQRLIEMDLAKQFDVGRGRVREAFRLLVGEGYLVFVANRGVLVRRYSRKEVLAMGRTREVLEGLIARLCAERTLSDEERTRLLDAQAEMDGQEAAGAHVDYTIANGNYHRLLSDMAGDALVKTFLEQVSLPLLQLHLPRHFVTDSMQRSNADHRVITTAILNGSADAAEAAMRRHVRDGNEHVRSLPASDLP